MAKSYYKGTMFHPGDRAAMNPVTDYYKIGIRTVKVLKKPTLRGVVYLESEQTGERFRCSTTLLMPLPS